MFLAVIFTIFISSTATLAVETNNPAVSEFGDKYLSAKEGE